MPGYSGKPLHTKLGVKPATTIVTVGAPRDYKALLQDPPKSVRITSTLKGTPEIVHVFATALEELEKQLPSLLKAIAKDGAIWVSWPKKASKVVTDITEDRIRDVALPLGLVDVKVCAVSDIWSGLKLVIRKENR